MEVVTLKAEKREALGSARTAELRAAGRVPCVVYGAGADNVNASLDAVDVERELRHHHRVFQLDLEGHLEGVLMQDIQFDVLTDHAIHIDFMRIDLNRPVRVQVELAYVGHPAGASKGGVLVKDKIAVEVDCLPSAVPESVEVAVKRLDIGDKILARELELPAGVTLAEGTEDDVVCHLPAPKAKAEEAPAVEEGAGAPAEEAGGGADEPASEQPSGD